MTVSVAELSESQRNDQDGLVELAEEIGKRGAGEKVPYFTALKRAQVWRLESASWLDEGLFYARKIFWVTCLPMNNFAQH